MWTYDSRTNSDQSAARRSLIACTGAVLEPVVKLSRWFRGGRSAPAISPATSLTTSPTNKFEKTWRKYKLLDTEWKEEGRDELKEKVHTMLGADNYNIAVIGPLGSGKSSLINSYISIMNERISSRTHAGFLSSSFTSYFQQIPGKGMFKNIIFYDTKGIEELDKGIPDEDIIKIAEGQIPPGYKFGDSTKKDTKVDENLRIHCLAYVLDAEHVKDGLKDEFRKKITDNMSKMKHICT
ncbi:uncharacterized protein LOC128553846, partial [Mercenaria mercenaria]|uniref:uncharacterized protein LOC128553846 n=1 Tax=Mercenaria mercenaria TaxID=6596 RepID=UPI00234E6624